MGKRAVLYAREASDPSHNAAAQLQACARLSQEHGYTVTGQFVDSDPQAPDRRPAFHQLRDLVAKGGADVVVCYTFDRLVRSPMDLRLLREELLRAGVNVECVHWDQRVD